MKRHIRLATLGLSLSAIGTLSAAYAVESSAATKAEVKSHAAKSDDAKSEEAEAGEAKAEKVEAEKAEAQEPKHVELFAAMRSGDLDVTIIAKNDHAGRVIIANKTGVPVEISTLR